MAKPSRQDAEMLLRIMEIYLSEPLKRVRAFWAAIPDGLGFEESLAKYPRSTEDFEQIGTVITFWETIGSLMKRGLLNQELAFDTFLDALVLVGIRAHEYRGLATALRSSTTPTGLCEQMQLAVVACQLGSSVRREGPRQIELLSIV